MIAAFFWSTKETKPPRGVQLSVELVGTFGDGSTTAGFGRVAYYQVPQVGDLLGPVDLVIDIPSRRLTGAAIFPAQSCNASWRY